VNRLVPAAGDFKPGDKIAPLGFDGFACGILICFEVIFPELARTLAKEGGAFFVNLTNDAWFGPTSAPYQHLSMARFRCVENRRPMVRAANTGFSAFIDANGGISNLSSLFEEEILKGLIRVSALSSTVYMRLGDFFAFLLTLLTGAKFAVTILRRRS
jgi:apolipoprotein N-acyltransferase